MASKEFENRSEEDYQQEIKWLKAHTEALESKVSLMQRGFKVGEDDGRKS